MSVSLPSSAPQASKSDAAKPRALVLPMSAHVRKLSRTKAATAPILSFRILTWLNGSAAERMAIQPRRDAAIGGGKVGADGQTGKTVQPGVGCDGGFCRHSWRGAPRTPKVQS